MSGLSNEYRHVAELSILVLWYLIDIFSTNSSVRNAVFSENDVFLVFHVAYEFELSERL